MTATARAEPSLVVLADSSLAVPVSALVREYSREYGVAVTASFASTREQAAAIAEGGAADVLITHESSLFDDLQQQGVIDITSRATVAHNRLALIGPQEGGVSVAVDEREFPAVPILNAMGLEPLFVIGHPEYFPEGRSAMEAMRSLDPQGYMEPYTIYPKESGQVLHVIHNLGAYGILLHSEALFAPGTRLMGLFPERSHSPITYQAAVVAGENMEQARKFLMFLQTHPAQLAMKEYGLEGK